MGSKKRDFYTKRIVCLVWVYYRKIVLTFIVPPYNLHIMEITKGQDVLLVDHVEQELRREILDRPSGFGIRLPHQEKLAQRYGVSMKTIRLAVDRLRRQRLVRCVRGKGTFTVSDPAAGREARIVVMKPGEPYSMMATSVLNLALQRRGLKSKLIASDDPHFSWDTVVSESDDLEGIFLLNGYPRDTVQNLVHISKVPVIQIGDMDEPFCGPPICDTVVPDNMLLVYRTTEYLIRQGHRRIVLVGWGSEKVWSNEMIRGYQAALRAHGIEFDPDLILYMPSQITIDANPAVLDSPQRQIDRWFERPDPPTALIHSAGSESKMHDILHLIFRGHFKDQAVIPASFLEILETSYTGIRDTAAFCTRLDELVARGLELLDRRKEHPNEPPVRETHGRIRFYRRKSGIWQEENQE